MVARTLTAGDEMTATIEDNGRMSSAGRAASGALGPLVSLGPSVDLATLSWCIGEIREALNQTEAALDAQRGAQDDDTAPLRLARLQLHQAHGALLVVDVPAASVLTEEAEAVLDAVAKGAVRLDAAVMNALRAAFAACVEYLDDLLHEQPDRPLYLFPYLQTLRKLRGAEREHPADLFFPDLTRRLSDGVELPHVSVGAFDPADAQDATDARKAFEKGLLKFLREPGKPRGIDYMLAAVGMVERHETNSVSRNFWRITLAFLEALRQRTLDPDVYTKRLLARLNLQLRKSVNEGSAVPDRLVQDTLYALACAQGGSSLVDTVRTVYGLEGAVPGDFMTPRYGRHDSRTIRAARDALNQARIAWDSVGRGHHADAGALVQALAAFQAAVQRLPVLGMQNLAGVLVDTGRTMADNPALFDAPVALEAATAILFADQILEQGGRAGEAFDTRTAELAARLTRAMEGGEVGSVPAWLQALSASAQERMTMASFIRETLASLRAAEQELDGFFRDPAKRQSLPEAARQLSQVSGALQLLGHQDAADGAQATARLVERFAESSVAPTPDECERVAANCGALGFFVEGLHQAHRQVGSFVYDPQTGEFRARLADTPRVSPMADVEASVRDHKQQAGDLLASLQQAPADHTVRAQLRGALEQVRDDALLRDDGTLKKQAAEAIDLLSIDSQEGIAKLSEALARMTPAAAASAAPPSQRIPEDAAAIDQELLEIFLAEAVEVLEAIEQAAASSRRAPSDQQFLTTIRRGFHTLKGSSRMVGLNAFGEAGWSLEQVMNQWLSEEQPGTPELYSLIDDARVRMGEWVARLEADATVRVEPAALIATAEKFRATGAYEPVTIDAEAEASDAAADVIDAAVADASGGVVEDVDAPVIEHAFDPAIDRTVDRAVEQEVAQAVDPAVAPVSDHAVDPVVDPVVDEVSDPVVDRSVDPLASEMVVVEPSEAPDDALALAAFDVDDAVTSFAEVPLGETIDTAAGSAVEQTIERAVDEAAEQAIDETVDAAAPVGEAFDEHHDVSFDAVDDAVDDAPVGLSIDPGIEAAIDEDIELSLPADAEFAFDEAIELTDVDVPAIGDGAISVDELAVRLDAVEWTSSGIVDADEPIELTDRIDVVDTSEPLRAVDLAELGLAPAGADEGVDIAVEGLVDDTAAGVSAGPAVDDIEQAPADASSVGMADDVAAEAVPSVADDPIAAFAAAFAADFVADFAADDEAEAADPFGVRADDPALPLTADSTGLDVPETIELDVLGPLSEPDMAFDPSSLNARMDEVVASLLKAAETAAEPVVESVAEPVAEAEAAEAKAAEPEAGEAEPAAEAEFVAEPKFVAEAELAAEAEPAAEAGAKPAETTPEPIAQAADDTVVIGDRSISRPLYQIFLGEADGLVTALAKDVTNWRAQPDRRASEAATRAAHSLCGSSALVGLDCVHALAARLEEIHLTQASTGFALEDGDFAAMAQAVDRMLMMLHQFAGGRMPVEDPDAMDGLALLHLRMLAAQQSAGAELPDDAATVADREIQRAVAQATPAMPIHEESAPPVVDELDAELLPIFIEEADDLLPGVGTDLRRWAENPSDAARARNLMRALHTIKGSARMAGAMTLGQLVHEMETRIEALTVLPLVPRSMIDELIAEHDQVMSLFEAIKDPASAEAAANGAAQAAAPVADTPTAAMMPAAAGTVVDTTAGQVAQAAKQAGAAAEPPPSAPASAPLPVAPIAAQTSAQTAPATAVTAPSSTLPSPVVPIAPNTSAGASSAKSGSAVAPSRAAPTPAPRLAAQPDAKPSTQLVRVRADLLDRVVNEAGEASIARSKLDNELTSMRQSLADLTENVNRLRTQLREIEIQAESQIQAQTREADRSFDPLEFDRYTRFQELTRMMAESVNDVATVQHNVARNLDEATQELVRQTQVLRDLQQNLMRVRMVQFGTIADRLFRVARQAAKETGKRVNLDVRGSTVEVDRGVLERMAGPLEHLVRNAVGHGIEARDARLAAGKSETGEIRVEVRQEGNEIILVLADDGGGLDLARIRARAVANGLIAADATISDRELRDLIFAPGFTTADKVTELSGRGVGMDVVRVETSTLGGRIETDSVPGRGSRFTIHLPLTLAVAQVVLVAAAGARFAVPSSSVEQVLQLKPEALADGYTNGHVEWQGNKVPLFYLGALVELQDRSPVAQHYSPVAILRSGSQRIALHVDTLARNQEVVVKNVGPQVSRVHGVSGATVLGNGDIVLIINPVQLAIEAVGPSLDALSASVPMIQQIALEMPPCVMVVDDSVTVRKVTQRLLAREGYQVLLAKDGVDALRQIQDTVPDVMLVDIEMPRMDGFDLTRAVRGDERHADIPIIMITSRTADKHRNMAFELGVNSYLGKPYSEEELLRQIEGFLTERGRSAPARRRH